MASSSSSSSERPIDDALMRSKVIELTTKLQALAKFDFWLALSIARSDENKIPSLLVPLGYDPQEFEAIVLFGKIWPGYGRCMRVKWTSFFQTTFGMTATIRPHNGIVCVNFHPQPTGCPKDVINGGGQRLMFLTRQIRAATSLALGCEGTSYDVMDTCKVSIPKVISGRRFKEVDIDCLVFNEVRGVLESMIDDITEVTEELELELKEEIATADGQHLDIADIKNRLSSGGSMTRKEMVDLHDLLSCLAKAGGVGDERPPSFAMNIGGPYGTPGVLLLPSRSAKPETSDTSVKTVTRRSKIFTHVIRSAGVGPRSIAKAMDQDEFTDLFDGALKKSKCLPRSSSSSVQHSLQQMRIHKMSWTALRQTKKISRGNDEPCSLSGENVLRKVAKDAEVKHKYYETTLLNATGDVESLVYVADASDTVAAEMDRIHKFKLAVNWKLQRDAGLPVVHLKIAEDKGNNSSKLVVTVVDQRSPNSKLNAALLATWEGLRYDQKDKPSDCYENMAAIFPLVPSLYQLHGSVLLQVGNGHVVVPRHVVRFQQAMRHKKLITREEEMAFMDKQKFIHSDAIRVAQSRAESPQDSAILVIDMSNHCIGVEAGAFCIALRSPQADHSTAMRLIEAFYSADLLSSADVGGMPDQSNSTSLFVRVAADKFKLLARGLLTSWELRTTASQKADLEEHQTQKGKRKYDHVNGVSRPSLMPCPYENFVVPVLHLTLGPSNKQKDVMNEDLAVLDCKNVELIREEASLSNLMREEVHQLSIVTNLLCESLGGFEPVSMRHVHQVLSLRVADRETKANRLSETLTSGSLCEASAISMRKELCVIQVEVEELKRSWNQIVDSSCKVAAIMSSLEGVRKGQADWEDTQQKKKAKKGKKTKEEKRCMRFD